MKPEPKPWLLIAGMVISLCKRGVMLCRLDALQFSYASRAEFQMQAPKLFGVVGAIVVNNPYARAVNCCDPDGWVAGRREFVGQQLQKIRLGGSQAVA